MDVAIRRGLSIVQMIQRLLVREKCNEEETKNYLQQVGNVL